MQDLKFPYALDKSENKSSVTLFFAYISFWETFILIILEGIYGQLLYALISSFVFFLICIFFYRARKMDGLKVSKDGFELKADTVDVKVQKLNEDKSLENIEGFGSVK